MLPSNKRISQNNVSNRFLPITESAEKGLEPEPKISDFSLIKELGVGSFGRVLLVQHNKTHAQYAIKAIDKRTKINIHEKKYFLREIEIMYRIHHPNVVRLYGHFEDNSYCYLIMEYVEYGNLYSYIPRNGYHKINMQQIASIIKDVICATYFLHHMNPPIIHRDIKPENVLLTAKMEAKLTDFGWSNYLEEGIKRTTVCGTPVYLCPEMINNSGHDQKVDIWCIGVLLFELITGVAPWEGSDVQTIKHNISRLKINWPSDMDPTAADLISKILKYNPEERISLRNMLKHPFFTQYFPNATKSLKRPDNTKYKVFVISRHNPLTWNPVYTGSSHNLEIQPNINNGNITNSTNKNNSINNNYDNLLQKYENLKKEYNQLKKAGFSSAALDSLKRELKEKEAKINQLLGKNKNNGYDKQIYTDTNSNTNTNTTITTNDYQNNYWQTTYYDLKNENYDLKNQLNLYQNHFNNQNEQTFFENDFNNIRNSIKENNKDEFTNAITQLRTDIDNATYNNYNTIINMKDKEIENWKEQERIRKEREKQQLNALINQYNQSLTMRERENKKLKMRLNELQGYFV